MSVPVWPMLMKHAMCFALAVLHKHSPQCLPPPLRDQVCVCVCVCVCVITYDPLLSLSLSLFLITHTHTHTFTHTHALTVRPESEELEELPPKPVTPKVLNFDRHAKSFDYAAAAEAVAMVTSFVWLCYTHIHTRTLSKI